MTNIPRTSRLMFGALAGPAAWTVQFNVQYAMSTTLCGSSSLLVHLITLLALGVTIAALVIAIRAWRVLQGESDAPRRKHLRARSLAYAGILASSFFTLVIIATAIPTVFFDPCQT